MFCLPDTTVEVFVSSKTPCEVDNRVELEVVAIKDLVAPSLVVVVSNFIGAFVGWLPIGFEVIGAFIVWLRSKVVGYVVGWFVVAGSVSPVKQHITLSINSQL